MRKYVSVVHNKNATYPEKPPFDPPVAWPEYPFPDCIDPTNDAYQLVREALLRLGTDKKHEGTSEWNPLGFFIRPQETVFLKPNMIAHRHRYCDDWDYVITHGSVVRAVVDYVYIAMCGKGRLIIGDGPQTDSQWDKIIERMGLNSICKLYQRKTNFLIELMDLRDEYWVEKDGIYTERVRLPGDPRGSVNFDIASYSAFSEVDGLCRKYYGAYYDAEETQRQHSGGRHVYAISKSPMLADVFINVPKLKTHKKCGVTVNLKSLVGINANKNWLPHYSFGSPETGGDQFDRGSVSTRIENNIVVQAKRLLLGNSQLFKTLARKGKRIAYRIFGSTDEVVRSGNWHGNDTVWRMCLDLNRIFLHGTAYGAWNTDGTMRRYFSIVDGIAAMEGNGPVEGTRRQTGVILAGGDPVIVDTVCTHLMGFDWKKLPIISRAYDPHPLPLTTCVFEDIEVLSNEPVWNRPLRHWPDKAVFRFEPHFGWKGAVESEDLETDSS